LAIPFKYEHVTDAGAYFRPADWLFTIDLASGYHHLGINNRYWQYLGFEWQGGFFVFTQLPFGLNVACQAFTKLMGAVVAHWRKQAIRLIAYLDDFCFAATARTAALALYQRIRADLGRLGFVVNESKVQLPAQKVRLLGFFIDTVAQEYSVPTDRRNKLLASLREVLGLATMPVRLLLSPAGMLMSMQVALGPIASFMSREFFRASTVRTTWESHVPVSEGVRRECVFWLEFFDRWNHTKIWDYRPRIRMTAYTDASGHAWGGHTSSFSTPIEARGSHPAEHLGKDSTFLEIAAYINFIKAILPHLQGKAISLSIGTDSAAGDKIWSRGAGHMRPDYNILLIELFTLCAAHDIRLHTFWVPRELNTHADRLSKIRDDDDLMFDPHEFQIMHNDPVWGPYDHDRCASTFNAQLPTFTSYWHCPGSAGVDCFSQDWAGVNNWCNPVFAFIPRILQHMSYCRARGTVLVPNWPDRPWYPLLFPRPGATAPWLLEVKRLKARHGLFRFAYGGSSRPAPAPRWDILLLRIDFSLHTL
jgi:hypothetical protein